MAFRRGDLVMAHVRCRVVGVRGSLLRLSVQGGGRQLLLVDTSSSSVAIDMITAAPDPEITDAHRARATQLASAAVADGDPPAQVVDRLARFLANEEALTDPGEATARRA